MKLEKNVAIVTGGAGAIGRAVALRLAREGAAIGVCDINIEKANKVAGEIKVSGGEAAAISLDVRNTKDINQMAGTVMNRFGRIDILVNAAGGSAREKNALLQNSEEEVIDEILGINLRGVIFCSRAVIGHMITKKRGKIVNIGSIVGVHGLAKLADYAAAKAGVIALTKTLAMELGPHGINVNCVSPGKVPRNNADLENIARTNYLGRIGKPEDVANLTMFLVSEEADFITGQNYIVDGGRSLGLKGD